MCVCSQGGAGGGVPRSNIFGEGLGGSQGPIFSGGVGGPGGSQGPIFSGGGIFFLGENGDTKNGDTKNGDTKNGDTKMATQNGDTKIATQNGDTKSGGAGGTPLAVTQEDCLVLECFCLTDLHADFLPDMLIVKNPIVTALLFMIFYDILHNNNQHRESIMNNFEKSSKTLHVFKSPGCISKID